VIEIVNFRLAPGADEEGFKLADRTVQTGFAYRQAGLLRRTTARGTDGGWVVITLWWNDEDADTSDRRWRDDEDAGTFMSFIDAATLRKGRFTTLD
jgi:hypothetical protein